MQNRVPRNRPPETLLSKSHEDLNLPLYTLNKNKDKKNNGQNRNAIPVGGKIVFRKW